MLSNPYQSPEESQQAESGSRPTGRVILGVILYVFAVCSGLLALLQGIAGGRWLLLETQDGVRSTNGFLFGFQITLGQALMLSAFGAALATMALLAIGHRLLKPRRTTSSQ